MRTAMAIAILITVVLAGGFIVSQSDGQGHSLPTLCKDSRTPISSLPFTIDECGSYYVTGCLNGLPGADGITVTSSDVTIDLNGFSLVGASGSIVGIRVVGSLRNITISNGIVVDWGSGGILAGSAKQCQFENLRISQCSSGYGLQAGFDSMVSACNVSENNTLGSDQSGILINSGSHAVNCTANRNNGHGISAAGNCTVTNCVAWNNGLDGILGSDNVRIVGCAVQSNSVGISTASFGFLSNNTIKSNGIGIFVPDVGVANRIEGNHISESTVCGIDIDGVDNFVVKNTAFNNGNAGTDNFCIRVPAENHVGLIVTNPGHIFTTPESWANFEFN